MKANYSLISRREKRLSFVKEWPWNSTLSRLSSSRGKYHALPDSPPMWCADLPSLLIALSYSVHLKSERTSYRSVGAMPMSKLVCECAEHGLTAHITPRKVVAVGITVTTGLSVYLFYRTLKRKRVLDDDDDDDVLSPPIQEENRNYPVENEEEPHGRLRAVWKSG